MSQSSSNKNLIFIITVLLLTNIAVLVYFLWLKKPEQHSRGGGGRGSGLTEMLQEEVGFNESQVAQYKQLREEQWQSIRPMFDEMRKAKDNLFKLMSDTTVNDSVINNAADAIAQQQKALDLQTFNHFKKVRALCVNPQQQVKYDSAMSHMFRKMGKPARRGEGKEEKRK